MRLEFTTHVHPTSKEDPLLFKALVIPLVVHPLGWSHYGYRFRHVDSFTPGGPNPHFDIVLTPGPIMQQKFPEFAKNNLSVCDVNKHVIYLHEDRWFRNIPDRSQLELPEYRAYLVSHEVGHILGKGHARCPATGGPAPTMVQQTLGIGKCTPSPWPSKSDADMAKRY